MSWYLCYMEATGPVWPSYFRWRFDKYEVLPAVHGFVTCQNAGNNMHLFFVFRFFSFCKETIFENNIIQNFDLQFCINSSVWDRKSRDPGRGPCHVQIVKKYNFPSGTFENDCLYRVHMYAFWKNTKETNFCKATEPVFLQPN